MRSSTSSNIWVPNRNCLFSFHHKYQHQIPFLLSLHNEDRMAKTTRRLLLDQLNEPSRTPNRCSLRKAMAMVIKHMEISNTTEWATQSRLWLSTAIASATAPTAHTLAIEALLGQTLERAALASFQLLTLPSPAASPMRMLRYN